MRGLRFFSAFGRRAGCRVLPSLRERVPVPGLAPPLRALDPHALARLAVAVAAVRRALERAELARAQALIERWRNVRVLGGGQA